MALTSLAGRGTFVVKFWFLNPILLNEYQHMPCKTHPRSGASHALNREQGRGMDVVNSSRSWETRILCQA